MWFKPFNYSGLKLTVVRNKINSQIFPGHILCTCDVPGPWGVNKCFKTIKHYTTDFLQQGKCYKLQWETPDSHKRLSCSQGIWYLSWPSEKQRTFSRQIDMTLYRTWTALQRHRSISCTMQLVLSLQEFSVDSSVGPQPLSFATQHITSKHDNLREHQTFICLQILFYFVNVNILPTCIHCFCLEPKEGSSRCQIPLELQTVVSLYRGVGNQSHVLLKSSKCS